MEYQRKFIYSLACKIKQQQTLRLLHVSLFAMTKQNGIRYRKQVNSYQACHAGNQPEGFHISLSVTTRHRLSARYCIRASLKINKFNRVFPAGLWLYIDQKHTNIICSSSSRNSFAGLNKNNKKTHTHISQKKTHATQRDFYWSSPFLAH